MESEGTDNKWYSATVLFKALHPGKARKRHLWQRSIILLKAPDESHALEKARQLAQADEHEYEAIGHDTVRWEFQSVEKILELLTDRPGEGDDVCWEFFERVDKT